MTKVPGVYAGGDVEHGPRTVVEAIRSGKIAANAIDAWLRGEPMDAATGTPVRRADVVPLQVAADERTHLPRAVMPERTVEEVLGQGNYVQIEEGLTDAMAHDEARRCLRCDVCIGCGLCMAACSEMGVDALRMADTDAGRLAYFDFTRPAELCIGCGACSQVCPTGAIRIEDQVGLFAGGTLGGGPPDLVRRTIITGTVVCEQPLLTCSECGAPTQTPAHRRIHPRSPARSHGGPPGPRALPVMRAAAGRPPRRKRCRARGSAGSHATGRSTPGDSGDRADTATKQGYLRRSHESRHGSAGGCGVGSLRGGPRTGREHRLDPGRGGRRRHLRNRRRDRLGRLRLGAPGAGPAHPRPRVARPGPRSRAERGLQAGDLIVGIVRRPDPVPCPNCAVGEWDMCRNGQYTERGIKQIDGFMSERWRIEPGTSPRWTPPSASSAVLLEPTTVVAKAWELVAVMRARAFWEPRQVLITGAGPIGMLAALIGVQHGLDVHVLDRVTEGAKPQLVARPRRHLPLRGHRRPGPRTRCRDRVHRGRLGDHRLDPPRRRRRGGLPHRSGQRRGAERALYRPTWPKRWSCRTTWSSARSTPTGGTSTGPPRRSPPPTRPGWRG